MGDIVSLSRARKARARAESTILAAANRAAFGRTPAQRANDTIEAERRARTLDGARRED